MSEITAKIMREVVVRALACDACQKEPVPTRQPETGWHDVPTPDGWYRLLRVDGDFHEYTDYCSIACLATWACNKTMEPQ